MISIPARCDYESYARSVVENTLLGVDLIIIIVFLVFNLYITYRYCIFIVFLWCNVNELNEVNQVILLNLVAKLNQFDQIL